MNYQLTICFSLLLSLNSFAQSSDASWIAVGQEIKTTPNSWYCFRKTIDIKKISKNIKAHIATDTKYWMWVNGKLLVYEGGLKRGPNPRDTYYDEVDLSSHLKIGKNTIAILVWFWGGKGFSHNNSGQSALYFDCAGDGFDLSSNKSWKAIQYTAYGPSTASQPNFRLSEPNIFFDAQKKIDGWFSTDYNDATWTNAVEIGKSPMAPWNQLVKRNIPLFHFGQLKSYSQTRWSGDTLICKLPYDGQFSPYLKIRASAGQRIFMSSDTYFMGAYPGDSLYTICSEYISKHGEQEYESFGWISGHEMRYKIPKGVTLISVMYRESGYAADLAGSFSCDDPFLNTLWKKAQRTLYVNMRDNYMDCPDRERAQWAGDAAMEMMQAFYSLSRSSDQLSRKLFLDLVNWQTPDSIIYNPVPESDWKKELPAHSLMPLSEIEKYFLYTKDTATIRHAYPSIKKYLAKWIMEPSGQLVYRKGGWDWGDWGDHIDFVLIQHGWYMLTLQTAKKIATMLGEQNDIELFDDKIKKLKTYLNGPDCWNCTEYRHNVDFIETDDRANALMFIAGVADSTKWPALLHVFQTQEHASPWMEKFILESMIQMGKADLALDRMKKRYQPMVESRYSTLWEFWRHTEGETHGNSGYNHGWAGGPLILLSQYYAGISPDEKRTDCYIIKPIDSRLHSVRTSMPLAKGMLKIAFEKNTNTLKFSCDIPKGISAVIALPKISRSYREIICNGDNIGKSKLTNLQLKGEDEKYYWVEVKSGHYDFIAK